MSIICRILGHRPLSGISPALCVAYQCARCRGLIPGGLAFWGAR